MNVDRGVQLLGALPESVVSGVIQIHAIGLAVDHGAAEAELADAAGKLRGCFRGLLQREVSKPAKSFRVQLNFLGKEVIGLPRETDSRSRILFDLDAGSGQGEDRVRNLILIHRRKAAFSEIRECADGLAKQVGADVHRRAPEIFDELRSHEVLLERDLLHCGLSSNADCVNAQRRSAPGAARACSCRG